MQKSGMGGRSERLWRTAGPLQNTVIIVGVLVGICALPFVVAAVSAVWGVAFPPPLIWADSSARATCTVESGAEGSTTVIRLPLEPIEGHTEATQPRIYSVELTHGSNAVTAIGRNAGVVVDDDQLAVSVSGLDAARGYSVEGIAVKALMGETRQSQTFQVGLESDGVTCQVGTAQEIRG